jgi:hypothetical protein
VICRKSDEFVPKGCRTGTNLNTRIHHFWVVLDFCGGGGGGGTDMLL